MRFAVAGGTGAVGRHVVEAGRARGHDVVVLSRRKGHDLESGRSVADALDGADAVIDVASVMTTSAKRSVEFFTGVTRQLLRAERAVGVGHHVALSIVGIDGIDASYYAGKLAQERLLEAAAHPVTVLRSTQFHEFAEQVVPRGSVGPLVAVPAALIRPIAAREVARHLVDLAEGPPLGRATDLVGPQDERLIDMVRAMFAVDGHRRPTLELTLPGAYWRGTASGVLRGAPPVVTGEQTFAQWLRSRDHTPAGS
jgi:uncharacterized protein YbjT (DUF2867 family)